MLQKTISILGSTGSVGKSTIDLVSANPDTFKIRALTAGKNIALLSEQAKASNAEFVAIADENLYSELKSSLADSPHIKCGAGESALLEAASMNTDLTMAAIVGFAGLKPVLTAIRHTKNIAIANKEPLVAAGPLVLKNAEEFGTTILPVDSEHNAIFQVLENANRNQIKKIILTASGGPFRTWTAEAMQSATVDQALAHPNWSMGAKISVDSASMMNKALEIIEAHYLFSLPANQIDVVIHPQSIIHSMVEYQDGSVLAQLGAPDMRTPIAYALAYPERMTTTGQTLDWQTLSALTFEKPDFTKFRALQLAYDALNAGPSQQIALNAANEIAVGKFLAREIPFGGIIPLVEQGLSLAPSNAPTSLGEIMDLDTEIRQKLF